MSNTQPVEAIAVVIPAHNESDLIEHCLKSVIAALDKVDVRSSIFVAASRCTDDTYAKALDVIGTRGIVFRDDSGTVVGARRHCADEALAHFADVPSDRLWLLSTDADTQVPEYWVSRILDNVKKGASAVAGLVRLDEASDLPQSVRVSYKQIVEAEVHGEYHERAHGANLAFRADAYLSVGGWSEVPHGEEKVLCRDLIESGWTVIRPSNIVVTTSGRLDARAELGLGYLLRKLCSSASA